MMIKTLLIAMIGFIILVPNIYAKDFGVRGQVFKIVEESFIAMLKKRLEKVDIEKEQQKMQQMARDRVENPVAVSDLTVTTNGRIFYFDPSYVLDKDAVLPCGKILHKAGTRVNPLDYMNLERQLFFIDARDKKQVAWLKERLEQVLIKQVGNLEHRIILVGGSVFKLKEELGKAHEDKIYFDQSGELVRKFAIQSVPAIAVQEGKALKIEELVMEE